MTARTVRVLQRITKAGSRAGSVGAMVSLAARAALAHDETANPGAVAEAVAPAFTGMGILILAVAAVGIWYYLQRHAMLRHIREQSRQTGQASGEPPSEDR